MKHTLSPSSASSSARPRPRSRAGFSLVEVIVALAIMVMIAATVVPSLVGAIDRERQDRAEEMIRTLMEAMDDFHLVAHVGQYPSQLSHLTTGIVGTDRNSCGSVYGNTRAGKWQGPYLDRTVPTAGLPVFVGTAENTLVRSPTSGSPATLTIRVLNVLFADAEAMDAKLDGAISGTTGIIRYGAVTGGTVTMEIAILISSC